MSKDVAIPENNGADVELSQEEKQRAAIAAIKERANAATSTSFDALLAASETDLDVLITREVYEKDALVGIPFFVTGVKFNPGKNNSDFCSLEITPQGMDPGVINDGGTGIRRQIVQMLVTKGIIDVGDAVVDPNSGEKFNALDNPVGLWSKGQESAHEPGFGPFNFLIPRGTRISTYTNEHGDSATWYLS